MTNLHTLLSEARARGKEPKLVEGLERLIADLSLLTPYDASGRLQGRWGIRAESGRPWEEPRDPDWMEISGHRWATDGAIAFREDAPRPLWRRGDPGFNFESFRGKGPLISGWLERASMPGGWEEPAIFSPRFAPLLRECPAAPAGLEVRMGACRRNGEIIALVMPLRRGCRGIGPTGLPVEAGPAVPVEPEEWTDADARRLRRLARKVRNDEIDGGARTSAKQHRELSVLQQKQARCAP